MSSEENLCIVEVMLNGQAHRVVVSGNNSPAFGFEPAERQAPSPTLLRFRCDICNGVAKLAFSPPSKSWRRPFVVRRVIHLSDE